MVAIANKTHDCWDLGGKRNPWENLRELVIHKTSIAKSEGEWNNDPVPDDQCDAVTLARHFRRPNNHTSGRVPYHFLVRRDDAATIEQMLPITVRGAHAIGHNWCSIAIAYLGEDPTPQQYRRLVQLSTLLVPVNALRVVGHTQLPGASADPHKVCPGPGAQIPSIIEAVRLSLGEGWRLLKRPDVEAALERAGVVI